MKNLFKVFCLTILTLSISQVTFAAFNGDISINSTDISFSNNNFLEGRTVRIYATAKNNTTEDLLGVVRFYDNKDQIGGDQAISIFAGKSDGVFIDWTPSSGQHQIAVKIFPWSPDIDDPSNNWIVSDVFVPADTDRDGVPNTSDDDDDSDGVKDSQDFKPLDPKEQTDTDGDGKGNNADDDDDNDGVPDTADDLPLDNQETTDTDKDGIGNIADTDDDNDGLSDNDEDILNTNPVKVDTDDDGVNDKQDAFALNSLETKDTDKDSIGNNADTDDDNDGILDNEDPFTENKGPIIKALDKEITSDILEEHTFDASQSYDEDGEILSYIWEIDGKTLEGNAITYRFDKLGEHEVKLTVTDDKGESRSANFIVSVLNLSFYKQIGSFLLILLLALITYFKYISQAKNSKDDISP